MSTPRALVLVLVLVLLGLTGGLVIGCGAGDAGTDGNSGADAGAGSNGCRVVLLVTPGQPIAGPLSEVRVDVTVLDVVGVPAYGWRIDGPTGDVPSLLAKPEGSAIVFTAASVGTYDVTLDVSSLGFCPQARTAINVTDGSGAVVDVRLRVTPAPGSGAPPFIRSQQVPAGSNFALGPVVLDPGLLVAATVTSGGVGIPAYLRFAPIGMSEAVVEAYAGSTGAVTSRVTNTNHQVLVIPTSPAIAPQRLAWSPGGTTLALSTATMITGVVRDPAGAALPGARVKLTIDGVPSTVATTTAAGAFSVLGRAVADASLVLEVVPPATSGLPRLEAVGRYLGATGLDVTYRSALAVRELAGAVVRRGGAPVAAAKVTLTGRITDAGTVAGIAADASGSVYVTGLVRVTATADGAGVLPTLRAMNAPLEAVVETVPGDVSVASVDLTAGVPSTIDAPAMVSIQPRALRGTMALAGARLDLIPRGALASAGVPTLHLSTSGTGLVNVLVAAGGRYDARWSDPGLHAGARIMADIGAADLQGDVALPDALVLSGTLSITGSANPVFGAAVEILCGGCGGLDRDRPLAEAASDQLGGFSLAVPDLQPL